jgi:myo-inositol-1(or 4)-monophosphatase
MMLPLTDYLDVCEKAVRVGGAVFQDWIGRFEVHKKGPTDLVTQADVACQEAVRDVVLQAFPSHSLLGEENTPANANQQRTEFRWIVDPIDGTTNYAHGFPHYCVSLALERNGELLVGAVYNPSPDECFTAIKRQGARLNGQPIHVSKVSAMSEALAAVGFPYDLHPQSPDLLLFMEMIYRCQAVRRTGSAALNLCDVAAGRFDLFWSYSTKIWDVAAGVLIVREAGGTVTSPTGGAFDLESGKFLTAATLPLHGQLCELAAKAVK